MTPGNKPHDFIAWQGVTAAGNLRPDFSLFHPFYLDPGSFVTTARARLDLFGKHGLRQGFFRAVFSPGIFHEFFNHMCWRNMVATDSRIEGRNIGIPHAGGEGGHSVMTHQALQRQILLAHIGGNKTLTCFDSLFTTFFREPGLNFIACARTGHKL